MHDKQIRRRRAVLVLLVVVSLILLTDYFGNSANSPLHGVQQGIADVLSPIQTGASKIFSPVRDVTNWISSTVDAKSQVSQLKSENSQLRTLVAQDQYDAAQYKQDQALLKLDDKTGIKQYDPVSASVISKDPILWYDTIEVDAGAAAGVKVNDPVIGEGGLVGNVSEVGNGWAEVTLITSSQIGGVGAMVESSNDDSGVLQPAVGNPSAMILNYIKPTNANISAGQLVVTSGFKDSSNPSVQSLYPPGIPIGTVTTQNAEESVLDNDKVQVRPSADLDHISVVQILTDPHKGR